MHNRIHRTLVWLLLLLFFSLPLHAATVTALVQRTSGVMATGAVIYLYPSNTPAVHSPGGLAISTSLRMTTDASGFASNNVLAGNYRFSVDQSTRDAGTINVPAGNGVYNLWALVSSTNVPLFTNVSAYILAGGGSGTSNLLTAPRLLPATGSTSTPGQVWTSTDTNGTGGWSNVVAGSSGQPASITLSNLAGTGALTNPAAFQPASGTLTNLAGTGGLTNGTSITNFVLGTSNALDGFIQSNRDTNAANFTAAVGLTNAVNLKAAQTDLLSISNLTWAVSNANWNIAVFNTNALAGKVDELGGVATNLTVFTNLYLGPNTNGYWTVSNASATAVGDLNFISTNGSGSRSALRINLTNMHVTLGAGLNVATGITNVGGGSLGNAGITYDTSGNLTLSGEAYSGSSSKFYAYGVVTRVEGSYGWSSTTVYSSPDTYVHRNQAGTVIIGRSASTTIASGSLLASNAAFGGGLHVTNFARISTNVLITNGVIEFLQVAATNTPGTDSARLFAANVGGTAELIAEDEAGNVVQLTAHPADAPPAFYIVTNWTRSLPEIRKTLNRYIGVVEWNNITLDALVRKWELRGTNPTSFPTNMRTSIAAALHEEETFATYNARLGYTNGHPDALVLCDWPAIHNARQFQYDLGRTNEIAAFNTPLLVPTYTNASNVVVTGFTNAVNTNVTVRAVKDIRKAMPQWLQARVALPAPAPPPAMDTNTVSGTPGPPGTNGTNGVSLTGPPGVNGTNGLNGLNGTNGINGVGIPGLNGTNGLPGASVTNWPALTRTNFISGRFYTNTTGRVLTALATIHLTNAAVNGVARMELVVGTRTNSVAHSTITTIAARFARVQLQDFINTNEVYYFTNTSSGANNATTIVPGSGTLMAQ